MDDKYIIDQMNYEIFLAEEGVKISLRQLDNRAKVVTEAADIEILNEATAEVIKTYIKKVAQSMQKAWDKFKGQIDYKTIHFIIDNNKKYLESDFKMKCPDDFMYPEINVWNDICNNCSLGALNSSNYAQMSQYLDNEDDFLKHYYNDYVEVENGQIMKFSDVFEKRCFSKADANHVVDNKLIQQYVDFLNKYQDQVKVIQEDIDTVNQVNENIDQLLNQIVKESTTYIGNILLEDGENQQQNQTITANKDNNNNKFKNADPNAEDPTKSNNKDRKRITTYYKVTTQILSAKMRTCNKVKNNTLRIVTNYVRLQGGLVKLPEKKPNENK